MKSATLRHTLNQVRAHPPKKLNSSLISEIHEKCTSAESLDDLLASSFFATVAWRFFHADVTNSHLELLLQVSTYEHEALSRQTCVETMKEDPSKLRDLLSRILQSTMVYRKQDVRLQACVFLFLRVLLVSSPSTLEDHPLFAKWCSSMFDSYTRALKTVPEGNTEMTSLLHCFLSLCLAAVVSKSVTCRDTVKDSWLPFHFMKEEFDFTTQRLASLIMLLLRPQPLEIFTSFQISIEKLSLQGKVPSAELAPSRFDVSAEEFGQNLHSLSKDDLLQLAEWAGCRNADESPDFLISVITHVVLGTGVSYRRLQNHEMFTEQDVFDLFDTPKQIAFVPSATFPAFMPLSTDYVAQIEARNAFEYLKQVNLRAESVLSRLTITDPTADRGIKGTSKYFSEIQHIEVYGSKARLNPKNNKIVGSINPGDVILLLEIQKPNRHGGVSRLIKNGINACALTRVHSTSEGIQVDWNSIGFEERFNALIVVPSPLGNTQEAYHQVPLCDTLVELASQDPEKASMDFSVDCIEETVLESLAEEAGTKKRKTNDNQAEPTVPPYVFNGCNVTVTENHGEDCLPEDLSRALLTMLSENTVVVGGVQGPQTTQLINAFLRTLSINWASETCLVVVPTKAAADLLDIQGTLLPLSFKCDSNGLHLFQKIASVIDGLEKVSQISGNLGLHGYDFESSIRTALMFYHAHVEPTWAKFLKSANEKNLHAYPFAYIERETFDDNLKAIADHFSGIRAIFAQLEGQLALDKFQLRELSQNDVEQIGDYFRKTSQYVIVPESDLGKIDRVFDNVIIHDVSSLPYIRGGFKRIAAFGDFPGDWAPRANVSVPQNRSELARLIGGGGVDAYPAFNPGLRHCVQHIKVADSKNGLNVEEAQFCVYLYQYMRLVGYPWASLSIGVASEQMGVLIEEILVEQKIHKADKPSQTPAAFSFGWPIIQHVKSFFPSEYTIVSCHGNPKIREYQEIAEKSRMGLYLVGSEADHPYKIKTGDLEIVSNEVYNSTKREGKNIRSLNRAAQLGQLVEQLKEKSKVNLTTV